MEWYENGKQLKAISNSFVSAISHGFVPSFVRFWFSNAVTDAYVLRILNLSQFVGDDEVIESIEYSDCNNRWCCRHSNINSTASKINVRMCVLEVPLFFVRFSVSASLYFSVDGIYLCDK